MPEISRRFAAFVRFWRKRGTSETTILANIFLNSCDSFAPCSGKANCFLSTI